MLPFNFLLTSIIIILIWLRYYKLAIILGFVSLVFAICLFSSVAINHFQIRY